MSDYLYRVQIVEYPKGALIESSRVPGYWFEDPDWAPKNWRPSAEWTERFGRDTGSAFFWPSTKKEWRSRSSAIKRKQLIESFGAKAIVQRTARIVWPEDGQERAGGAS